MSTLYLSCGLCGRKQADGLLSRVAWGHLERADQGTLRACPTCKERHTDWQDKLVTPVDGGSASGYGVGQSAFG